MIQYYCRDCGWRVNLMVGERPGDCRCSECRWVVENIPPEEHTLVRERLGLMRREWRLPTEFDCGPG